MSTPDEHDQYTHLEEPRALPEPGPPPEHGAQWDEVHGRWEKWDDDAQRWVIVGDPGDGVDPSQEAVLPPLLASELVHAEALESEAEPEVVEDVDRKPEPPEHIPGAQWNEVLGRWEHWDDTIGEWIAVD